VTTPAAAPATSTQLRVRLRPDGQVASETAVLDPLGAWRVLGCTRHNGVSVAFVRAEIAGACWVALVPTAHLEPGRRGPLVTLERQGQPGQDPLVGWAHFC
jgi:hypothetical protein